MDISLSCIWARLSRTACLAAVAALTVLLGVACSAPTDPQQLNLLRNKADQEVKRLEGKMSLDSIVSLATAQGDRMLEMRARQQLGLYYRENNRFMEAITCHRKELQLANLLGDTVAIVQAYNNIGTNFRRMGVLDEAIDCHYQALHYSDAFSHRNDSIARKNHVKSLNGIGNICLTLGDTETADSVFRQALAGERQLSSPLGQAINYANIGSLFEQRGMTDSARAYYSRSMEMNRRAKSDIGIALCHTHFGRLYEKEGDTRRAIEQYSKAYDIMEASSDRWHWLEACLALANVYVKRGEYSIAKQYLGKADKAAQELHSLEHQSQVAMLYYHIYNNEGDCRRALAAYRLSQELGDSVASEKNLVHMQNMRIRYEHEQRQAEVDAINKEYQTERTLKTVSLAAALFILLFAVVTTSFLVYALRTRKRKQMAQQQLDEMRLSFFTNITHEFRTPLTIILGYSQMMENGKLPPGTLAEAGRVVSRQGERLLSLINQLLDIQKVKSAVGRPEWRHGNIALFVSTIIESYLNLAHTQRIKLMYTPRQKEAEADFVPDYLQKVVCNLVSNAIKFSSEGGRVLVTLDVAGGTATLRIADSGCGISAADCKHVFEPFYQTESENMGVGSGVGLALVKQIVVSLGGSIKLDSSPGKGSVFTVTLPATAPDGTECAPIGIHGELTQMPMPSDDDTATADVSGSNATDRPLLLVVEDNRDVAHYMCIQLQDGYRLMVADNGEEGLRIANEQLPDIIVTDLMMPRMDGYELCRRIKTSQLTDHIPMVVVTARASESDKLHGLQLGVDAYIYKPFNADELRLCVDNLIAKHRMLRERYMKAAAENEAEATDTLQPSERLFVEKLNATVDKLMPIGELAVDNVAAAMCMSSQQMRRKLNAVTGDTPAAYIRRRQMQTAQAMLIADNDTPVGEIAMRCGFYDMSHFTRVFKQVTGSTPTAFRNART